MKAVVLALAIAIKISVGLQVSLLCQSTSSTICASNFMYAVRGSGLQTKYCLPVGKTCEIGPITMELSNCTNDYKYSVCTTKVCYTSVASLPYCSNDFVNCNSTVNNYTYSCDVCRSFFNCAGCLQDYKDTVKQGA